MPHDPRSPNVAVVKAARPLVTLLAALLLLAGCSTPTQDNAAESMHQWAAVQAATNYPGLRMETTYLGPEDQFGKDSPNPTIKGVLAHVTVPSRAVAEQFVRDYRGRAQLVGASLPRIDARITWPVTGGLTVLHVSVRSPDPDGMWERADLALPAGVTERHLGWTSFWQAELELPWRSDTDFVQVEELVTNTPRALARRQLTGPFPFLLRTPGSAADASFLGPGTMEKIAEQADDLVTLESSGVAIAQYLGSGRKYYDAGSVTLASPSQLPTAIAALEGSDWWFTGGAVEAPARDARPQYLDLLPTLATTPGLTSAIISPGTSDWGPTLEVTAPDCDDVLALLPNDPDPLGFTCQNPTTGGWLWLQRPHAELQHELPILERAQSLGAVTVSYQTSKGAMTLGVRLNPTAEGQWQDALRELRTLNWPDTATITLQLDAPANQANQVTFTSTATGLTDADSPLAEAWNASAPIK